MEETANLTATKKASNTRWGVAYFSALISCGIGVLFGYIIFTPGLGDGVHHVRWFHYLALLPAAAYALLAIVAIWFPHKRNLTPVLSIALACFVPNIGVSFVVHPLAGLIMAATLILPLLFLYSLLQRSVTTSCSEDKKDIQ